MSFVLALECAGMIVSPSGGDPVLYAMNEPATAADGAKRPVDADAPSLAGIGMLSDSRR